MKKRKSKKGNKLLWGLLLIMLIGVIGACSGENESDTVDRSMPMLEEMPEPEEGVVEQEPEEVSERVVSMVEDEAEATEEPTSEPTATPVPTPEPTATPEPTPEPTAEPVIERAPVPAGTDYILNTNTKKFHYTGCRSVKQMKEKNKKYYTGTREECIGMGYDPCGNCEP